MAIAGYHHNFPDSRSLYEACQSSDGQTQMGAYQALGSYLFTFALQLIADQADAEQLAEDCAQEALLRIHRQHTQCVPAAFLGWCRVIVRNLVFDELKRRKKLGISLALDAEEEAVEQTETRYTKPNIATTASLEAEVVGQVHHQQLRDLLAYAPVSEHARYVLLAFYFEDKTHEEIAQAETLRTGRLISPANTMVTLAKAIAKLRTYSPLLQFFRTNSP